MTLVSIDTAPVLTTWQEVLNQNFDHALEIRIDFNDHKHILGLHWSMKLFGCCKSWDKF